MVVLVGCVIRLMICCCWLLFCCFIVLLVLGLLDSCVGMVCQLAGLVFGFGCSGVVVSLVVVLVGIALFVDLLASLFSICLELASCCG